MWHLSSGDMVLASHVRFRVARTSLFSAQLTSSSFVSSPTDGGSFLRTLAKRLMVVSSGIFPRHAGTSLILFEYSSSSCRRQTREEAC